jgi:RNA polymerase sigma-70 factor (ECF subfamily)
MTAKRRVCQAQPAADWRKSTGSRRERNPRRATDRSDRNTHSLRSPPAGTSAARICLPAVVRRRPRAPFDRWDKAFARDPLLLAPWLDVPLPDELESKLVARLVAQDERAFNELVRAYERRVLALVLRMIGNRAEAEDLAQEVFVQVFKAIGTFRGESKLSTWIYRIAINLCKNRSKYLRVRHADDQQELEAVAERVPLGEARRANVGQVARPDEMMSGKQVEQIVQRAIVQLDPSFRECLVLRDVEELSYEEIEQITGLAAGTVKSRIHRGRAMLREIVERELGEKIG